MTQHSLPATGDPRAIRVGLALSGGGFRAAAFHLGVLKRLEELRILHRVEALSCVSGGSITGALYALRCAEETDGSPGSYPVDQLIAELLPALTANLRAHALFGSPIRAIWTLSSFFLRRVSRTGLISRELDRRLFGGATVDRLPPWIVINATNLRTGKAWKFYRDRAGDYLVGATEDTASIRVADAVAASAAYPGLTDSYGFRTRWDRMRVDLLDGERWERPTGTVGGGISGWRERYGDVTGDVIFPLVDGGLYDNEGANGLRGRRVTHAMLSGVAPPEGDGSPGFGPGRLMRLVEVIHDRLGASTRQLVHEMTHGMHPSDAARTARALAEDLRASAGHEDTPPTLRTSLEAFSDRAEALARVGRPPRGHQFTASAQMLLHRTDLAKNSFADPDRGGLDVPPEFRGLDAGIVAELSRVRTDLDALEPETLALLMSQGYFLADFFVKLTMPELLPVGATPGNWYADESAPTWPPAHAAVTRANGDREATSARLAHAQHRVGLLGRVPSSRWRWWYRGMMAIAAAPVIAITGLLIASAVAGLLAIFAWLIR